MDFERLAQVSFKSDSSSPPSHDLFFSTKRFSSVTSTGCIIEKDKFGDLNCDWFYLLPLNDSFLDDDEKYLRKDTRSTIGSGKIYLTTSKTSKKA